VPAPLDTGCVLTDEPELALVVGYTGRGLDDDHPLADDSCVPLELCRAGTDRTMVLCSTEGIPAAGPEHGARVLATSVDAGHCEGAAVVRSAGVNAPPPFTHGSSPAVSVVQADWSHDGSAVDVGIPSVAGSALALGPVGDW